MNRQRPFPSALCRGSRNFLQQAIIMLYFSGRVCYDLAGVRPATTEHLLKRWKRCPPPYDTEGSENLSLR